MIEITKDTNYLDLIKKTEDSYVVKDLISTNFSCLAGEPKAGKSFLALDLALCIASGESFLGRETIEGNVLYVSFEDDRDLILERMGCRSEALKHKLYLMVSPDKYGVELLEEIRINNSEVEEGFALVILDTLPLFMKLNSENKYLKDYQAYGEISKFCTSNEINVLGILHTKKERLGPERNFDKLYGTNGIKAALHGVALVIGNSPERLTLHYIGKRIRNGSIKIGMNDKLGFNLIEDEYTELIDSYISAVMNYIITIKEYSGSCESLVAKLKLPIDPRFLGKLLMTNKDLLEANNIKYTYIRTSKARKVKLTHSELGEIVDGG